MGMLLAWKGQRQKDKTVKNHPYNTNNNTKSDRKLLGGPDASSLPGTYLAGPAGQAILLLLSASPPCPAQPFYKAYTSLFYCLGLMEWDSVLPRKSFRTLLQFFCIVFHSVDPSKTHDLWCVFYPSA